MKRLKPRSAEGKKGGKDTKGDVYGFCFNEWRRERGGGGEGKEETKGRAKAFLLYENLPCERLEKRGGKKKSSVGAGCRGPQVFHDE